jgi:hypothetical protein
MNKVIVLLFVLSTIACSVPQVKNPINVKALLPPGSTLRLTQKLTIPKDRSFIYIAKGKVAALKNYNTVDIYEPYCMFYVNKEVPYQREVLPDEFKVTKIIEWERYFSKLDIMNVMSNYRKKPEFIKTGYASDDGAPGIVMYATIISLHSNKQPEIEKLVCGHWNYPHEIEPLTLEEMKFALGDLILINKL